MRELEYAPNSRAASLARRATRNIIYLTSLPADIAYTNPHMFDILCGVQGALSEKGYTLTIMDTCHEERPGSTAEQIILQKLADGMIVHAGWIRIRLWAGRSRRSICWNEGIEISAS